MKSITVLRASSFRALKPQLFDSVILAELSEAVKEQYKFRQVPTIEELATKPANFVFGELKHEDRLIVVEQLIVTYVGTQLTSIAASTHSSTDDSDIFLDNLILWVADKFKLDTTPAFPRAYHSVLEVALDGSIVHYFEALSAIGQNIAGFEKKYGVGNCPEYQVGAFSMHFDTGAPPSLTPTPTPFTFERRAGARYDENKYFSQAPLRTDDHKAVLDQLEKLLLK